MAIICRLPANGPKLRPIDRAILDHLGDARKPMTASDIYAKCGRVFELGVIRSALDRLVAMGFASRVDVADMFKTYAAEVCGGCGQFVSDRPHDCQRRRWFPLFIAWGEVEPALALAAVVVVILALVFAYAF